MRKNTLVLPQVVEKGRGRREGRDSGRVIVEAVKALSRRIDGNRENKTKTFTYNRQKYIKRNLKFSYQISSYQGDLLFA